MTDTMSAGVKFDYGKLRGRTVEMGKRDKDVAIAADMTPTTYSLKINGNGYFSQDQIFAICSFLSIPLSDSTAYFFTPKV